MWLQPKSQPKQNINLTKNNKDANWLLSFSKINYLFQLSTNLASSSMPITTTLKKNKQQARPIPKTSFLHK
jgi:hypothetical protein